MSEPQDNDGVAEDARAAARYYRRLIAEGVPRDVAVRLTASWISGQEIAKIFGEDVDREPWQP